MTHIQYPHTFLYGWTAVVALASFVGGLVSVLKGVGIGVDLCILPDIPGGCILILLSVILGTAVTKGRTDRPGWISFSYIGALLLLAFAVCAILVEGGTYLTRVIEGEEGNVLAIISSAFIWVAILALPLLVGISKLLSECSCGGDRCE